MKPTGVIIVAGGGGSRMGAARPKQFMFLCDKPILAHTINNFAAALPGAKIVVVLPAAHTDFWRNLSARFDIASHIVVEGGQERFHSVRNGLAALPEDVELIAVQDGVRPLGSRELILRTIASAAEYGAAVPVIEVVDSLREVEADTNNEQTVNPENEVDNGLKQRFDSEAKNDDLHNHTDTPHHTISHIIDRRRLRIVQTPQVFRAELLRRAYQAAYQIAFTDDASVAEQAGATIRLCQGERMNLKITTPEDLIIAEALLAAQNEEQADAEHL